jgi:hypothetical protein
MPATAGGQETFYITNITTALPPPTCPAISLAPLTLPNGTAGVAYSQAITGSGGTAPYSVVTSSALPAGLTLTPTGGLTGTLATAGTFTFSIRITDATGCFFERSYTMLILNAVPTLPQLFLALLALSLPTAGYLRLRRRDRAM